MARNSAFTPRRWAKQPEVGTDLLRCWLLTVVCIVYSDIFPSFNSPYVPSTLSTLILDIPKCHFVGLGCFFGTRKFPREVPQLPSHNIKKIWHKFAIMGALNHPYSPTLPPTWCNGLVLSCVTARAAMTEKLLEKKVNRCSWFNTSLCTGTRRNRRFNEQ